MGIKSVLGRRPKMSQKAIRSLWAGGSVRVGMEGMEYYRIF